MSIRPRSLLDYARKQLEVTEETCIRAGISRAYYCVFHSFTPLLDAFPGLEQLDAWLSHRELIHRLESWNVGQNAKLQEQQGAAYNIAQRLKYVRARRTVADYELDQTIDVEILKDVIARCDELKKKAGQLKIAIDAATNSAAADTPSPAGN